MKNVTMKKILIIIFAAGIIYGCTPDEFKPIGDKPDRVAQLEGVWQLSKVIQTDNDAVNKGFPLFAQEQDVTDYFDFSDLQLTLKADKSFEVNTGAAPNVFKGDLGQWSVDSNEFPAEIYLKSNALNDTINIGSFAHISSGQLSLKRIRYQEKSGDFTPAITYTYQFEKQN